MPVVNESSIILFKKFNEYVDNRKFHSSVWFCPELQFVRVKGNCSGLNHLTNFVRFNFISDNIRFTG